ncbi:MAG: pantetheine-phosphate adenylyltransferase [Clostridia bacterium]|nr:pantetheine-phosphate adenylyltransferase [Clostridia bacterium]MBR3806152.1 pantetheine-phosphate adenylyltransferase [Clostridia bacterium]
MRVILPGSYDPVTLGHLDIIKRASEEFDEVFVVAFVNPKKKYRFSVEDRVAMLMLATEEFDNVLVSYSDGLVVDYMREHGIEKIVKGYRTEADLPWEREQAEYNLKHGGYETELWKCREGLEGISSTLVRESLSVGESCEELLPSAVADYIKKSIEK